QSLSFHDVLGLRHLLKLRPAPEFEAWLSQMGMLDEAGQLPPPNTETLKRLISYE
ncbi:MAG: ethanolamine ammonia-lyase subunit EutB, partial [Ferrovibrio sp.]